MGFFKDFKRDFAQAVNELMPDQDELANEYDDEDMVNTFDENDNMDIAPEDMLEDLDDLSLDIEKGEYDDDDDYENDDASYDDDLDDDENYDENYDDDSLEDIPQAEMIEEKHDISIDNLDKSAKSHNDAEEYVDVEELLFKEFLADEEPEKKEEEDKPKPAKPKTVKKPAASGKKPAPSKGKASGEAEKPAEDEEPESADTTMADDKQEEADTDVASEKEKTSENEETEVADTSSEKTEDEDKAKAIEDDKKNKADSLFDVDLEKAALEAVLKQEEKKENNKKGKENSMEEKQTDDNINEADIIAELMEVDTDISISQKGENVESILSEDTTYVTKGTKITGSISTEGGIDLIGTVEGDVECKGKLIVGGCVKGNVVAGEVYANAARIEGETKSDGSVKIGVGTVVVGNIIASSAVIAGAVNGDIDVKGPVIVDSTAVIMGNIKSRSVQINNGAVIEGFCSQCYSEIDVKSFFE